MRTKRLNIGFLIHHLDNDYAKVLLSGAFEAAEDLNINLAVFPGRSLNCQLADQKYSIYEYQHNVIYSLVSPETLDAAVVSVGTLGSFVTKEEFKSFLDGFGDLPVVTMESKVRGYPCIRLSSSGIKDIVNHLIKDHGKRNIAFVSGPSGNSDADERLGFYKEALAENGIPYNENMVAYGNFSEYCVDLVGSLIDRNHGKIDAICFANDMMCKGGYKAIEQRGLVVGKDIAVTGYDDSEVAAALRPMLTTVRADASKLGYEAVVQAVRLIETGTTEDRSLDSSVVLRSSCGCEMIPESSDDAEICTAKTPQQLTDIILADVYANLRKSKHAKAAVDRFNTYITKVLCFAADESICPQDDLDLRADLDDIILSDIMKVISTDTLLKITKSINNTAEQLCMGSSEKKCAVYSLMQYTFEALAERMHRAYYNKLEDLTFTHFLICNITKDMTVYGSNEEKSYFSVVNNLCRLHMYSSYIYTYEEPIINTNKSEWKLPDKLLLKAYHDMDKLCSLTGSAQSLDTKNFLNNNYTPDRRRVSVVTPLYINEEQYGIMLAEPETDYITYIYSIAPQICTAIKLTGLVTQLENSLDAAQYRNNMLNYMSMSDELTGIYNRRGFYKFANHSFRNPENEGKRAVLIFADLDNLKQINDTFGHDDGDYAIVQASGFLKSGLRNTDIVARIGGDEFAAFALCSDSEIIKSLPNRIKRIAAQHNLDSGKPYNVNISIGIHELICSPENTIQEFMDKADAALYADKKLKSLDIFKHKENS